MFMKLDHINNRYDYIDACRKAGLTKDSMFFEVEEAIFDYMESKGFGLPAGYGADANDREEARDRAFDTARLIHHMI